jgi:site-specific recombinase XerD
MYLEQVFESTQVTLERLRTGPLHQRAEGFTGWMLKVGYSPVTIRDHLRRIAYLNEYLGRRRAPPKKALTAKDIERFFKWYCTHCRPKPSEGCVKLMRRSINRFTDYLGEAGLFDPLVEPPVYQPLLDSYLAWLRKHRQSAPATLKLRSNYVTKFMAWLGPSVTTRDLSELTPERVEEFSIAYARTTGRSGRQSMQTSLRTFLRFCLHKGYIQKPLDKAVPTLRTSKDL